MNLLRALYDLLRLGARLAHVGQRFKIAARRRAQTGGLMLAAAMFGGLAFCFLLLALDRVLAPHLGEAGAAFLLALLLLLAAASLLWRAQRLVKAPPPLPAVAIPPQSEEMSNAALLALLGGLVVGTVLQSKRPPKTKV